MSIGLKTSAFSVFTPSQVGKIFRDIPKGHWTKLKFQVPETGKNQGSIRTPAEALFLFRQLLQGMLCHSRGFW